MNNYSITAIAINIYLSEAHPTKTRVAQAKAECKSSAPKDEVLLRSSVANYFVMAQQYTVVETIEKLACYIGDYGTSYPLH